MQSYLLFIDTETTDLPKNWTADYAVTDNWPSAVQIAWILYTSDGRELKRENFFICNNDVPISRRALAIHGFNQQYLQQHGVPRQQVMHLLAADLIKYQPLVVGHFINLDVHVLGADFFRCSITNPLPTLTLFCTMLASAKYASKPWVKYLRLSELYEELFGELLQDTHNAQIDAEATAKSFFELDRRGEVTDEIVWAQQQHFIAKKPAYNIHWYLVVGLSIVAFILLIAYLIFQSYG